MRTLLNEESLLINILNYEKNFKVNSIDFLKNCDLRNKEELEFKELLDDFFFFNENLFKINQIFDVRYVYFNVKDTSERDFCFKIRNFLEHDFKNTVVIIKNNDFFYKTVIEKMSARAIPVILITDKKEDLELKNYYPYLIIYRDFTVIKRNNIILQIL